MDAMEAILTRRSIRKYTESAVPGDLIEEILEAAMAAPSAGNEQPWHFVVINKRELLDAIPRFHPHSKMLKHAPVAVLVCGDLSLEKHKGYWVQDCSAATQNLLLAAHALGLGAVWLGVFPREERVKGLSKLLGLPENIVPLALVSMGYAAEEKPRADRFKEERIRYNGW